MSDDRDTLEQLMSASHLFDGIGTNDLADLVAGARTVKSRAGQKVIAEGQFIEGLHLLVDGAVRISKASGGQVADIQKGSFFGEISLFGTTLCATASVESITPVTLVVIPRQVISVWFQTHPHVETTFLRNLCIELCNRLEATTDKLGTAFRRITSYGG
jgi:CRP-like cAMP-binding protein